MNQLTKEPIFFKKLNVSGHLYQAWYQDGNIAIVAGEEGRIGKLSVNLVHLINELNENEFFIKLYGEYVNDDCFSTGLFEKIGDPFHEGEFEDVKFQKWRLKNNPA